MGMLVYQLLRPFSYLFIKHQIKWMYDWLVPGIFTIIIGALSFLLGIDANVYASGGLLDRILAFAQNLPGFYIAALAAIATFGREDIDQYMPDPTPKVKIFVNGSENTINLTRRRFLCMLFSFLTAESIAIALFCVIVPVIAQGVKECVGMASPIVSVIGVSMITFMLAQMVVATMLGLYYLGDRLHQPTG